ncbi:MAG: hypothetical protein KGJ59_14230 [Bacteroidota bacterium]|nr:hypothetical protein [Bacteroidota bacterium]
MEILKSLDQSSIVRSYVVLEYRTFQFGFFIKIKAALIDGSELHIKEYSDETERNYSYHWQSDAGVLITRWDNAPHYSNLSTFPHHKHQEGKILPSEEILLEDVLEHLRERLHA